MAECETNRFRLSPHPIALHDHPDVGILDLHIGAHLCSCTNHTHQEMRYIQVAQDRAEGEAVSGATFAAESRHTPQSCDTACKTERLNRREERRVNAEETLQRVPLFQGLQPKQVKGLARWTTTRTYDANTPIVRQGQPGIGLYCIQSGKVRVTQQTQQGEREIRSMGPGESFGELSLLQEQPRSATVTAVEPTTCVLLDQVQFNVELKSHPEIAVPMLHVLATWLQDAEAASARGQA